MRQDLPGFGGGGVGPFIEPVGGVPEEECVASSQAVQEALAELNISIAMVRGPAEAHPAKRLLVMVIIAWELMVADTNLQPYVRGYAWLRLVKLWGALRLDDLLWMDPMQLKWETVGLLHAKIRRTKSTGSGKVVETLHMWISRGA